MSRVLLVHWHREEGEQRAARLVRAGHEVRLHWQHEAGGELTRSFGSDPVDAVVVDLGRLPSHGRAVATWMRGRKATRRLPIVFVPGDPEKTARLQTAFPDAVFAPWARLGTALKKAIAKPPADPVVPKTPDYSGTPLAKKLGVKADSVLVAVRAPADFAATLGPLPAGAVLRKRLGGEAQVVVVFCRSLAELRADWAGAAASLAERGGLWVAWPKKASGVLTDLDDGVVRAFGLDRGLVDNKVCAIDGVWSGLRFARRRT